jgi:hypothetical protein
VCLLFCVAHNKTGSVGVKPGHMPNFPARERARWQEMVDFNEAEEAAKLRLRLIMGCCLPGFAV